MENEAVLLAMRIGFVVCLAATAALVLRHFMLPKENSATSESNTPPRGHTIIGANAQNGGQIAVTDGNVMQVNQAPKPTFEVSQRTEWEEVSEGIFRMNVFLNIKNAFNSNGLCFFVLGEGIESVGILGGNSGFLSTGRGGKIDKGAFIECMTPSNVSGVSITSSSKTENIDIRMDAM